MVARRRAAASSLLLCGAALLLSAATTAPVRAAAADSDADTCSADDDRPECRELLQLQEEECVDDNESCRAWADTGECEDNPGYMLSHCRRSCNVCEYELVANDLGVSQSIPAHAAEATREVIANSLEYYKEVLASPDPEYAKAARDECRNRERRCSEWATGTGCDDNPKYMKRECCPACRSFDYVWEMRKQCSPDYSDGTNAIEAGGMDELFERMVRVASESDLEPKVWSRPEKKDEPNEDGTSSTLPCEEDVTNPCDALSGGPWVITLENFVTPEEIDVLLRWGSDMGYERSQAGDAVIEARTSAHAWCNDGGCYQDPTVKGVTDRISRVTGVPSANFECLQLLKYEAGQYYRPHNDFITKHVDQSHGPRLMTFFIYFNEVEEGGSTRFPRLNPPEGLTVEPRRGRVLVWPSVLDEDPLREDKRTEHEAVAVVRGEKYAANAWVHTRDFQTPFRAGCPS